MTGAGAAADLERLTLEVYRQGAELCAERGIIVAGARLEPGFDAGGQLLPAGEVLTPDSSRFWPADWWQPGRPQPPSGMQYVRDWLDSPGPGWDRHRDPGPPPLPAQVAERTGDLYIEAYQRITGRCWT